MPNCKYCDRPLPVSRIKRGATICSGCEKRLPLVRRFGQACDEFKQRIGYEAILRERERRAEK